MTDNIEREKFDVYWGERRWPLERITNPSGYVEYKNAAVQNIWMGWQARAALSQPAAGGAVGEMSECPPQPEFRCATAAPDESRELSLIEFARSYVVRGLDENVSYEQGVLAAFNESRKR